MQTIKVLQITIGGNEFTGVASFLYQYYQKMDHRKVHFDFLFCKGNSMKLVADNPVFDESEFYVLNSVKGNNKIDYIDLGKKFVKILKSNKYDVIHINTIRMSVTIYLMVLAKVNGIKTVFTHCHSTRKLNKKQSGPVRLVRGLAKGAGGAWIRKNSTRMFACSVDAGVALFGKKGVADGNFCVVKNAIDSEKFAFCEEKRMKIREELELEDCVVLGQVGRLCKEKNQKFSIDVLEYILQHIKAKLLIVGTGESEQELRDYAKSKKLEDNVLFLGARSDVNYVMQGMDMLMFPSFFEGLGIVAIEAQAAGIPVYASTEVPKETEITDLISFMPLSDGADKWGEYILGDYVKKARKDTREYIENSGYDIMTAVKKMEEFYLNAGFVK